MNILITNTQEDQAYLVVRSLRHLAERIVVTLAGRNVVERWSGPAPWSRYVARRYAAPEPSDAWWEGLIRPENSPDEEAYIRRIEAICAREKIDAVFPSFDPDTYVLSKNKARLAALGVTVVGPDFQSLQIAMDKERTIQAAREVGYPHPRTFIPEGPEDLDQVIAELPPPWVIKPRFTAHGKSIRIAETAEQLRALHAEVHGRQPRPLVQEFIPGYRRQNYYIVVDRNMEIVSLFAPKVIRTRQHGFMQSNSACISSSKAPDEAALRALVKRIGYWGCLTVQNVVDSRTGTARLMEVNPRVGNRLWYRLVLGVNEPEIFLRMALNQPLPAIPSYPEGVYVADPVTDVRHLGDRILERAADGLKSLAGRKSGPADYIESQTIGELVASMKESYFGAAPVAIAPYVRNVLDDPAPCMLRNLKIIGGLALVWRYFRR